MNSRSVHVYDVPMYSENDLQRALATARKVERDRILALHKPIDRGRVMNCCGGCEAVNGDFHDDCCHEWPCPTVDYLTGDTA